MQGPCYVCHFNNSEYVSLILCFFQFKWLFFFLIRHVTQIKKKKICSFYNKNKIHLFESESTWFVFRCSNFKSNICGGFPMRSLLCALPRTRWHWFFFFCFPSFFLNHIQSFFFQVDCNIYLFFSGPNNCPN